MTKGDARGLAELAPYLKEAGRFSPLTREEEHALAVRARRGDVRAKHRLVRQNLTFVVAIARKQLRGSVRLDDLVQEGNVGLVQAVDKFDPNAGTRFLTYAIWWIRAYIGKYLRAARSSVRPRSGATAQPDLALDAQESGGEVASHLERLVDGAPSPEEVYLAAESEQAVRRTLDELHGQVSELAWDVVRHRLGQEPPSPLEEIGRRWGVSREWVRRVELDTKRALRRRLKESGSYTDRNAA